jgi:hypothetical protein
VDDGEEIERCEHCNVVLRFGLHRETIDCVRALNFIRNTVYQALVKHAQTYGKTFDYQTTK